MQWFLVGWFLAESQVQFGHDKIKSGRKLHKTITRVKVVVQVWMDVSMGRAETRETPIRTQSELGAGAAGMTVPCKYQCRTVPFEEGDSKITTRTNTRNGR